MVKSNKNLLYRTEVLVFYWCTAHIKDMVRWFFFYLFITHYKMHFHLCTYISCILLHGKLYLLILNTIETGVIRVEPLSFQGLQRSPEQTRL